MPLPAGDHYAKAAEVAQLEAAEAVADASIEYQAGKGIPSLGVPPPRIDQDDATVYSPDGAWALPPNAVQPGPSCAQECNRRCIDHCRANNNDQEGTCREDCDGMCHQGCFPSEKKRDPMEEGTNRLDEELRQKEKLLLAVKDCVPACMSQCAPQCVKNGASPNVCAGECNSYCKRDCALEAKLGSNPLAGAKAAGDGSGDEFEFLSVDEAVDPKDSPKMDSRELGAAHCEPHCNDECNAECGKGYHSPHKCASECEASCAAYCAPLYATGRPVTPNLKLAPAAPGADRKSVV